MNWDFWRVTLPNAAVVFALAAVPFFAMALHLASDERPSAIQEAGASLPLAMIDGRLLPRLE